MKSLYQGNPRVGNPVTSANPHCELCAAANCWLRLIETPEDGEVEARTDFLPETFPARFRRTIAPDPILTFGEFVFRIPAEHTET